MLFQNIDYSIKLVMQCHRASTFSTAAYILFIAPMSIIFITIIVRDILMSQFFILFVVDKKTLKI